MGWAIYFVCVGVFMIGEWLLLVKCTSPRRIAVGTLLGYGGLIGAVVAALFFNLG